MTVKTREGSAGFFTTYASVSRALAATTISLTVALCGCESSDSGDSASWEDPKPPAQDANTSSKSEASGVGSDGSGQNDNASGGDAGNSSSDSAGAVASATADAVSYGSLKWKYGGFNGGSAKHSSVEISGAKFSAHGVSFKYKKDLSAWGLSHGDAGAVFCLFVQNNSGAWVGGKIDWISSSRTSRDFKNVYERYAGWSLADVPNPTQAAIVIVSKDGKKRSNVIVGSWKR